MRRSTELMATWFGAGRAPLAPGTFGSLGAIPLHAVLRRTPIWLHALATVSLTAYGFWAANEHAEHLGQEDPASTVIDEVVGALIAMGMVRRRSLSAQALALVLFRVLDITKPGPIDSVQRARPAGVGIMSDDLLAGLLAGIIALGFTRR